MPKNVENYLVNDNGHDWQVTHNIKPSDRQVGGSHYKDYDIEPGEYAQKNGLGYLEGNAIKYISRHTQKGGVEDLDKAIHCLELIKEWVYGQ